MQSREAARATAYDADEPSPAEAGTCELTRTVRDLISEDDSRDIPEFIKVDNGQDQEQGKD